MRLRVVHAGAYATGAARTLQASLEALWHASGNLACWLTRNHSPRNLACWLTEEPECMNQISANAVDASLAQWILLSNKLEFGLFCCKVDAIPKGA